MLQYICSISTCLCKWHLIFPWFPAQPRRPAMFSGCGWHLTSGSCWLIAVHRISTWSHQRATVPWTLRELIYNNIYTTWGEGKSSSKMAFRRGYVSSQEGVDMYNIKAMETLQAVNWPQKMFWIMMLTRCVSNRFVYAIVLVGLLWHYRLILIDCSID